VDSPGRFTCSGSSCDAAIAGVVNVCSSASVFTEPQKTNPAKIDIIIVFIISFSLSYSVQQPAGFKMLPEFAQSLQMPSSTPPP
jgi:hypothetical protein